MRGIKLLIVFTWLVLAARSQPDSLLIKSASGKILKRLGKNAIRQNDPASAITFYSTYLQKHKNDAGVMNSLAKAYMQVRDYDRAQHMFLNAYKANKVKQIEALYYHAKMQKSNGLYDSAKTNFALFKKTYKGGNKLLKKQAGKEIAFCDSVHNIEKVKNKILIQRLDTSINKVNTEAAPLVVDDNTLVYTSLRTDKKEVITEEDSSTYIKRKLYYAKKKNGKWKFAGEYGNLLNDKDFNTGNATLSPDKNRIYFTRCKPNYKEEMICAIYVSEKKDGEWTEPVKLPKSINNPKYSSSMPAVTTDPVKGNDIIYFVSNNKKGRGGLDIWFTSYNKKTKQYRLPKNAGTKINTSQNEITPFFDTETQSLYFSSDGMGGMGGYDVFKATGDGKRWMSVANIGQPINTGADELYYIISKSRRDGYFVSNRKGGSALKNSTCCDDIYLYINSEYVNVNLKGSVSDGTDPFDPVSGATVEIYLKSADSDEKLLVKTVTTDNKGNYETNLEPNQDYLLVVKKKDYLGTTGDISTRGITASKDMAKNLRISKRPKGPLGIPNIQYQFDQSKMLESSKASLDASVLQLMLLNPEIIIEIQSHTDSKGNDNYNLKLSQRRAQSVVDYLISKGISPKRLIATGMGETMPIAPNENPDGSDNPEGRAKNRRTDFKIVGETSKEQLEADDND